MPENFFKRHQYTFAGIGAIAAVLAGVFTFVGNSSTRNEIRDNSGTIVGVGEQVTLESGAVIVNEYNADLEGLKNAAASLRIAGVQCKTVLAEKDNIAQNKVFQKISQPAFHVAGMLYDPKMSSALSEEVINYIDRTVNQRLTPNGMLISTLAEQEASDKRRLEFRLDSEKMRMQADPKYQNDPEQFETDWEKFKSGQQQAKPTMNVAKLTIDVHQQQNPDAEFYDVLLDEETPIAIRLDRATDELMTDFAVFCAETQKIHAQLEKTL
ncbi:MAG: hypothetical protein CMI63_02175 [Parvularcula sp.]|nr:hypothetical protein [Parvularcula sp.]